MIFVKERLRTLLIFGLLIMTACVEPYSPPTSNDNADLLVIDGFLNATSGIASIKLTHTINLYDAIPPPALTGATVRIESQGGQVIPLTEVDDGFYRKDNITVDISSQYKLRITTKEGKKYSSDYIELRQSPIFDNVIWKPTPEGIYIYVNSHDPSNNTTYYRYTFDEIFEYRSNYVSDWKKVGGRPVFRTTAEQVYTCWDSTFSQSVLTVSTARLTEDVVKMFPIRFIEKGSKLLGRTYSINVQQRAISQREFEYWDLIRKTTESLGGLFDPIPSQVLGNVHNDDDAFEKVLGYFSGGTVKKQRIYIGFYDLPDDLRTVEPKDFICELSFVPINNLSSVGDREFVAQVGQPPTGYTASSPNCVDCRTLGGENVKPKYWPQ